MRHLAAVMIFTATFVRAQTATVSALGFWNLENLYDTLNDKWKNDDDFTPGGSYGWTGARYYAKLGRLSEVIALMASDVSPDGLALLGVCEVENKTVLTDLVHTPQLAARNYQFIHIEGPDARGVDPALIYNPKYFSVRDAVSVPVRLVVDTAHRTRDILVVSGELMGEPVTVLVNHWPSRRGGELKSSANRKAAARVARRIADSVARAAPATRIVIMGDLNDDPVNESVKRTIGTVARPADIRPGMFFNPMERMYNKGIGTLAWRDTWNLFDQVMLSSQWLSGDNGWQYADVMIFNKSFLRADYGNFRGYPFRTYTNGTYAGGYSDHFPVYVIVKKTKP